jgi:hypothetical protein
VHDEELLACHDDVRPVPAPDGCSRDDRRGGEQDGADDRQRPAEDEPDGAERAEHERARQRPDEDDAVPPRIDVHVLRLVRQHGVARFDGKGRNPRTYG